MLSSRVKKVFIAKDGGLRAVWRILLGCAAYFVIAYGVSAAITYLLARLFATWGVNASTVSRAPAYAKLIYTYSSGLTSIASSLLVILAFRLIKKSITINNAKAAIIACVSGITAVVIPSIAFILFDSVRLVYRAPNITFGLPLMLVTCLLAAAAEEFFVRGFVFDALIRKSNKYIAYAVTTAILILLTGAYSLSAIGIINSALLSVLTLLMYERFGHMSVIGFRFGYGFAAAAIVGQNSAAMYEIYTVSENLLTGGNGGLISGLVLTLAYSVAIIVFICRARSEKTPL